MKKITAKYITENLKAMAYGQRVEHKGATYWMQCDSFINCDGNLKLDTDNGTIYYISADRNILGSINGYEYGKVVDGVAYRV